MRTWYLEYDGFDPNNEPLREAICTLGNGYFATRGASEFHHADGVHYPGTYLAGGYNRLASEVAGKIIENEDLVNWPNWLYLTFKIEGDDHWFKPEDVEILEYRQTLIIKEGILRKDILFRDKLGRETSLRSCRLVSMDNPHIASISWVLTPINWSGKINIVHALDGSVKNDGVARYRSLNNQHLNIIEKGRQDECIYLLVQTNQSRLYMAQTARLRILQKGKLHIDRRVTEEEKKIFEELTVDVKMSKPLKLEKTVALYTSRDNAISEPLTEAIEAVTRAGSFAKLFKKHREAWERIWYRFDIRVVVRGHTQLLLRLHLFHLIQTCSMHSVDLDVGVPARGWHGEAYRGHIFWDELFIFPLLNLHLPDLTRALLLYRYRRLPAARAAARSAGFCGAMFPWQSASNGKEESQVLHLNPNSGKWIPDHTYLQRHVNLAIAYNIWQYFETTDDLDFLHFYGAEMLLEIARFLSSLASFNEERNKYEIKNVVGPDEFHTAYPDTETPGIHNNAYTNVLTIWVLIHACKSFKLLYDYRERELLTKLGIDKEEFKHWDHISRNMYIPLRDDGIILQFDGYDDLLEFDWERYGRKYGNLRRLDRILDAEGDSVNRYKVSKQADVLMLFYLFSIDELSFLFQWAGYSFEASYVPANINYYTARTSDGSTLSRLVRSWVEARANRTGAYRIFKQALVSDIEDVQGGTTPEGIHLGSMAGTVDIIQRCFTGLELRDNILRFNPSLPEEIISLEYRMIYESCWLHFFLDKENFSITYEEGRKESIRIGYQGQIYHLTKGEKMTFKLKRAYTEEVNVKP